MEGDVEKVLRRVARIPLPWPGREISTMMSTDIIEAARRALGEEVGDVGQEG